MRRTWLVALLVLTVFLTLCSTASAHSTKGRMKIDLDLEKPTINDFAFFMESYVYKEFYRDREPQWENRFYVKDFKGLELQGNQAVVRFLTLDTKTHKDFADAMRFTRDQDGRWYFTPSRGKKVKVYTYVMKGGYYYKKYGLPLSIAGLILSVGVLGLLYFLRRRKTVAACDFSPSNPVPRETEIAKTPATGVAAPPEQTN